MSRSTRAERRVLHSLKHLPPIALQRAQRGGEVVRRLWLLQLALQPLFVGGLLADAGSF
jgi:hypothetical protein